MKKAFLIIFISLLSPVLWAQQIEWELIAEIPVKGADQVSLDNRGQIYYTTFDGGLYQLSSTGLQINHYSPSRQARITQLEAAWTVNVFTFSKDLQRFELFDRFLNPIMSRDLNDFDIGLARAGTLGNNNSVWVFDESNLSLKRVDYRRQSIVQSQPLNLVLEEQEWEVLDLKETKNILFMRVPGRVVLFDNQGNFLKRLTVPGENNLSITGDNLYNMENENIVEYNWNTGMKTAFNLPSVYNNYFVKTSADLIVFYNQSSILIYKNLFYRNR